MRSAWSACPTQWYYGYLLSLRKAAVSVHLHFGGAIARGLEITRRAYWQDGLDEINSVSAGLKALIEFWGDFELPGEIAESRAGVKTLEACMDAFISYWEEFPLGSDQIEPLMIDGEPMVEKSFALPVPDTAHPVTGEPILYAGRFDLLARLNHAIFVVDEKTAGSLGSMWRSNWRLRGQLTGYCWGGRSFGLDIAGCIVRGLGILKGSITFEQAILTRPQWMVDDWLRQLSRDINRAASMWRSARDLFADAPHRAFDRALDSACSAYGGCGFASLCEAESPVPWYSEYIVRRWDPLNRDGDIP